MNILIIGSKGFIGSHLSYFLKKKGYTVFGADVVVDYSATNYFLVDATNDDFNFIFENNEFHVCINCSGAANVSDSIKNPSRDYYLNTVNVFKMLDAIRKFQPTCKFLNLSSAAVYGNPIQLPIKENFSPQPLSPYGLHKLQAEEICNEFYNFYNLKTCSVRIFSAYGIGLQKQLFWDLFKKSESKELINLYGTGNESRDFIYIDDLVYAIELCIKHADFNSDIINVASGDEIFIKDAVRIFYSFFEKKIDFSFLGQERLGDPNNWKADISKLKSFGYVPETSIEVGLQKYYTWICQKKKDE